MRGARLERPLLRPHDIVDRYVVEGLLGRGGMAVVYAVRHRILGVRRALKVPQDARPQLVERLLEEGRIQARLDPAHVVPVTDVIEVEGHPALLMPLVEGCALDELVQAVPLAHEEVLAVVAGITAGVREAHAHGIVHRDLKPANVLLELRRSAVVPRVSDFGVAKVLGSGPATTRVGTPRYAAPEQLHGGAVDGRADLYAIGLIWLELATGEPVDDTDVSALPAAWRPVVGALLEADPSRRTATAEALAHELSALGADPGVLHRSERLVRAVRSLRDRHAPSPDTFVTGAEPVGSASAEAASLPVERDAFVGRGAELEALDAALRRTGWVAVVGPGGVGKSRLALHYATSGSPGGERLWCDLVGCAEREALLGVVAAAVGVPLTGGDPVRIVGKALAARGACLVVLDDADLVVEDLGDIVAAWRAIAPDVAVIATSRVIVPAAGEVLELDVLGPRDAASLFEVRARAVRAGWRGDPDEEAAVRALVTELDGLPLAVELAAARTAVLSPPKLLARLGERFRLLARAGRTDRHATLRACLDASWTLLTQAEQATLAQLTVFEGGFDVGALEAVVDLGAHPDHPWPLDALEGLVRHSLVRRSARDRFDLLVSVRAFAREALRGELAGAEVRHGRWAARLGADLAVPLAEVRNVTAACRRSRDRGDAATMVACLRGLWDVLSQRGPYPPLIELALGCLPVASTPVQAAEVQWVIASALRYHGDLDGAAAHAHAGLTAAAVAPEEGLRAALQLRNTLGAIAYARGDLTTARDAFAELVAAVRELPGQPHLASTLGSLGLVELFLGRFELAASHLDAAIAEAEVRGGKLAALLGNRGLVEQERGHLADARRYQERALAAAEAAQDARNVGVAHSNLANALFLLGEVDEAAAHYRGALQAHRDVGDRRSVVHPLANLAVIAMSQEQWGEALVLLAEALEVAEAFDDALVLPALLQNLAKARAMSGDPRWREPVDRAVAVAPSAATRANALTARCWLHLHVGDMTAAMADIDAAEALDVQSAESAALSYARAVVLRTQHRHREADAAVAEGDRRAGTQFAPHTSVGELRQRALASSDPSANSSTQ